MRLTERRSEQELLVPALPEAVVLQGRDLTGVGIFVPF